MNANLQFDFFVDKEKNTITIKREFAASRQLVWDCYTKSELLERWFAPNPLTTKTKSMRFEEGGHWHYVMLAPEGNEYWGRMEYLSIHPIDAYTCLDAFCDESGTINPQLPRAKWEVTLTEVSNHTLVQTIVSYDSLEALETVIQMGMQDGITLTLEHLDELLLTLNA